MILEELRTARDLLNAALNRYQAACSALADSYDPGNPLKAISQAISEVVPSELELIVSCEAKFQRIKATVRQTRNLIPSIVPINVLPPNILAHIFDLVLPTETWYIWNDHVKTPFPLNYPETVSFVCTHWRRVAIDSHALWSQIYIDRDPPEELNRDMVARCLLTRAETFADRAAAVPLSINIQDKRTTFDFSDIEAELNAFHASISPRIKSLDMAFRVFTETDLATLRSCLADCTPGTLNWISITAQGGICQFIEAATNAENWSLDLPQQQFKDVLLPVNVLRLDGVYFHWSSPVYHGLVELCLIGTYHEMPPPISELYLAKILAASPGLRIFQFGLEIIDLLPHENSSSPVSLRYLEDIDIRRTNNDQYGVIIRHLSPGPNDLRLSLTCSQNEHVFPTDFNQEFFDLSMVKELCFRSRGLLSTSMDTPLSKILGSLPLPELRTLTLSF